MHPLLNIATKAARSAGDIIVRYVDRIDTLNISQKSINDFVSEVDRLAEQEIIGIIRKAYPNHGILAEESGVQNSSDEYCWTIDPLDGTTNFLHQFPQFSVSIAVERKKQVEQCVVYDPLRQELFSANKGSGSQLNGRRLRVSKATSLEGSLLGTGFPYRDFSYIDSYLETFKDLMQCTAGIRRAGSAALDLAYVAAGRLDGFWEFGLKRWDIAAGSLLIQESGGVVSDANGKEDYLNKGHIVGGNLKTHRALLNKVQGYLDEQFK